MVPIAGSAYTYAYATLGEFVAWIIGWDLILEYGISVAPTRRGVVRLRAKFPRRVRREVPASLRVAHVVFTSGGIDFAHSQIDVLAIAVGARHLRRCWRSAFASRRAPTRCSSSSRSSRSSCSSSRCSARCIPRAFVPPFPRGGSGVIAGRGAGVLRLHRLRHGDRRVGRGARPGPRRAARGDRLADHRHRRLHGGGVRDGRHRAVADGRSQRRDGRRGQARRQRRLAQRGRVRRRVRRHDDRHAHLAAWGRSASSS